GGHDHVHPSPPSPFTRPSHLLAPTPPAVNVHKRSPRVSSSTRRLAASPTSRTPTATAGGCTRAPDNVARPARVIGVIDPRCGPTSHPPRHEPRSAGYRAAQPRQLGVPRGCRRP